MQFDLLTIDGFGPYADRQVIDFAELARKGLFSVTGVTGAGKTTIFDALTYALYGEPPGARDARLVRSDHVRPGDPTVVELQFTAGNDHWKVTRSPEYDRPKRRGPGFTKKTAEASLARMVGSQWDPQSTNTTEVNARCKELVGLDKGQFERVGLLPQGEFRRFLHASSSERKELFRTLFGTDQINRAVAGLKQSSADANTAAYGAEAAAQQEVSRARQATAQLQNVLDEHKSEDLVLFPMQAAEKDSSNGQAAIGPVEGLTRAAQDVETTVIPLLAAAEAQSQERLKAAGTALQRAQDHQEQLARRSELQNIRRQLDENRPAAEQAASAAERARRAAPVADANRRLVADQQALDTARAAEATALGTARMGFRAVDLHLDEALPARELHQIVDTHLERFAKLADAQREKVRLQKRFDSESGELKTLMVQGIALGEAEEAAQQCHISLTIQFDTARSASSALAALTAQEKAQRILVEAAQRRDSAGAALDKTDAALIVATSTFAAAQAEATALADQMKAATNLAEQLPARAAQLAEATETHQAVLTRDAAQNELSIIRKAHDQARKELDSISRTFAAGVAPRLAEQLIDDEPCMVCGSPDHPAPASWSGQRVRVDEDAVTQASQAHQAAVKSLAAQGEKLEGLVAKVGTVTLDAAAKIQSEAQGLRDQSAQAAGAATTIKTELDAVHATATEAQSTIASLREALKEHQSALEAAEAVLGADGGQTADLAAALANISTAAIEAANLSTQQDSITGKLAVTAEKLQLTGSKQRELDERKTRQEALLDGLAEQIERTVLALTDAQDQDPVEVLAELRAAKDSLADLEAARERVGPALAALDRSRSDYEKAIAAAAFPSAAEALAAELDPDQLESLAVLSASFVEESTQCDADLQAIAGLSLPTVAAELEALRTTLSETEASALAATEQRVKTVAMVRDGAALADSLKGQLVHVAQLRAAADDRERIAQLCDAKGSSKISLEGYVLRGYLEQVVGQANIRLSALSAGRYRLLLADSARDGRGEWGLDLRVSDAHTGQSREVKSLSGGETFYTSLALALGLSDVLSNNGSSSVNSVFIDEGFGSLDQDVIDLTVDVLSQLGGDGVTVGVITHVDAVRDALPAGLTVERLSSGASRVIQHA